MFDQLATAEGTRGAGAVGAWARVENAACARRLAAMADTLDARLAADGSAEREQWCLDNWDAVAADIGAAMNVSTGVASHQLMVAQALRERLPLVAEVFAAGVISYRMVNTIVARTRLIQHPAALAKIDAELAAHVTGWGALSATKAEKAIDYWVDRYDPQALRRAESRSRGRHLDVSPDPGGAGTASVQGQLFGHHGAALTKRLDAMAHTLCANDPRTLDQRRADAMGALADGADRLACECASPNCEAGNAPPSAVVVHVIAEQDSLTEDSPVQLDGTGPTDPSTDELRDMTVPEALAPQPPLGPAPTNPAAVIGGAILPAPLLAAKLATTATIRPLIHPGDSPPESRYRPSQALADFVRCRDMTCRFPGCDEPADQSDLDHTIAYPHGPTCASNIKCLCRKHHLLKTFWGWGDRQLPDGTVIWTNPPARSTPPNPAARCCSRRCADPPHPSPHPPRRPLPTNRRAPWRFHDEPTPAPKTANAQSKSNASSTTTTSPNATNRHR